MCMCVCVRVCVCVCVFRVNPSTCDEAASESPASDPPLRYSPLIPNCAVMM